MAIYGLDLYGKATYGTVVDFLFSADPMVAAQSDHGVLQVTWATPQQVFLFSTPYTWSRLRLVRNSYGVPDTEDDGWVCLDLSAGDGTAGNPSQLVNSFVDSTVVEGRHYYYAIFVAATVPQYVGTTTYQPGDLCSFNGQNWQCVAANTYNVPPSTTTPQWSATTVTTPWYRCGSGCVGLVVRDAGHTHLLYDLIPRPYKVATVETTATEVPLNSDLFAFLSIFGFHFDAMKTENDALLNLNNIADCTDRQLSLIAQQLGIVERLPALPELRRAFVRDAMSIQRGAGSAATLAQLVTDITGWEATVSIGYNEFQNMDTAAFSSTRALPWDPNTMYVSAANPPSNSDLVTYNGALYQATNGTVQYSLYNMQGAVSNTGSGAMYFVVDPAVGRMDTGYAWWSNPTPGDAMTVTFSITQPPTS
jgi:hypothetical protein